MEEGDGGEDGGDGGRWRWIWRCACITTVNMREYGDSCRIRRHYVCVEGIWSPWCACISVRVRVREYGARGYLHGKVLGVYVCTHDVA